MTTCHRLPTSKQQLTAATTAQRIAYFPTTSLVAAANDLAWFGGECDKESLVSRGARQKDNAQRLRRRGR